MELSKVNMDDMLAAVEAVPLICTVYSMVQKARDEVLLGRLITSAPCSIVYV